MRYALIYVMLLNGLTSCTLSFNNIETNGRASDVVEDSQDARADLQASIPVK